MSEQHQSVDAWATPPAEGAPESAPHSSSSSCADRETRIAAGDWRKHVCVYCKGRLYSGGVCEIPECIAALRADLDAVVRQAEGTATHHPDCEDDACHPKCVHVGVALPVPDPGTAEGAETMTAAGEDAAGTATGSATDLARERDYLRDVVAGQANAVTRKEAEIARLALQLHEAQHRLIEQEGATRAYHQGILEMQSDPEFRTLHTALVQAQRTASEAGLGELRAETALREEKARLSSQLAGMSELLRETPHDTACHPSEGVHTERCQRVMAALSAAQAPTPQETTD